LVVGFSFIELMYYSFIPNLKIILSVELF
jgi:hypothetical protein